MIHTTGAYKLPAPLPLEDGGLLPSAQVAYEAVGVSPGEEATVVLLHDLSTSHRGLGVPDGWARPLCEAVLPGTPVLLPNLLGSPFGSTSAATLGDSLPPLSVEDMARATAALLRGLGLTRVRALIGVGLGGVVALTVAALFEELAAGVITLGTSRILPESLRERLALTPQLLRADPSPRNLAKLRLELLRRERGRDGLLEQRLEEEAEAFSRTFDGGAYATLCAAYGHADLGPRLEKVRAKVLLVASASDELAPPMRVRETYHALGAAGVRAHYYELQSEGGHAQLTREVEKLRGPLRAFLSSLQG